MKIENENPCCYLDSSNRKIMIHESTIYWLIHCSQQKVLTTLIHSLYIHTKKKNQIMKKYMKARLVESNP